MRLTVIYIIYIMSVALIIITSAVDWALQANYLSIYIICHTSISFHVRFPLQKTHGLLNKLSISRIISLLM